MNQENENLTDLNELTNRIDHHQIATHNSLVCTETAPKKQP